MKRLLVFALLAAVGISELDAQVNTNAIAQILALVTTNPPAAKTNGEQSPITIHSTRAVFENLTDHHMSYLGNVRLTNAEMTLTCERLVADLPQAGQRMDHVVAETNVVINFWESKGKTYHAVGDKAVYDYNILGTMTNETVTLTAHPAQVESEGNTNFSDTIIWHRIEGRIEFEGNPYMILSPPSSARPQGNGTNAPATTNAPPAVPSSVATNAASSVAAPLAANLTATNAPPASTNEAPPESY